MDKRALKLKPDWRSGTFEELDDEPASVLEPLQNVTTMTSRWRHSKIWGLSTDVGAVRRSLNVIFHTPEMSFPVTQPPLVPPEQLLCPGHGSSHVCRAPWSYFTSVRIKYLSQTKKAAVKPALCKFTIVPT